MMARGSCAHVGEGKRGKDMERIENRRTGRQTDAVVCFFASRRTVRFILSVMNRWHPSTEPGRHCQHMPCTPLTLMERLFDCGYVITIIIIKTRRLRGSFSLKDYNQQGR